MLLLFVYFFFSLHSSNAYFSSLFFAHRNNFGKSLPLSSTRNEEDRIPYTFVPRSGTVVIFRVLIYSMIKGEIQAISKNYLVIFTCKITRISEIFIIKYACFNYKFIVPTSSAGPGGVGRQREECGEAGQDNPITNGLI